MKVAEFRDKIDAVYQWLASLKGCQRNERPNEARILRKAVAELRAAMIRCVAAKPRDIERATMALGEADNALKDCLETSDYAVVIVRKDDVEIDTNIETLTVPAHLEYARLTGLFRIDDNSPTLFYKGNSADRAATVDHLRRLATWIENNG